jgi:hypothetical protein
MIAQLFSLNLTSFCGSSRSGVGIFVAGVVSQNPNAQESCCSNPKRFLPSAKRLKEALLATPLGIEWFELLSFGHEILNSSDWIVLAHIPS